MPCSSEECNCDNNLKIKEELNLVTKCLVNALSHMENRELVTEETINWWIKHRKFDDEKEAVVTKSIPTKK